MGTQARPAPPLNNGGEYRTQGKGPHDDVEVRVAYGLTHAPRHAKWTQNVELREFRITDIGGSWRVMLKGRRKGKAMVAFFNAETWRDAIALSVTSLDTGYVTWRPDRYPATKT